MNLVANPPTPFRIGKRPPGPENRPAIEEPRGGWCCNKTTPPHQPKPADAPRSGFVYKRQAASPLFQNANNSAQCHTKHTKTQQNPQNFKKKRRGFYPTYFSQSQGHLAAAASPAAAIRQFGPPNKKWTARSERPNTPSGRSPLRSDRRRVAR